MDGVSLFQRPSRLRPSHHHHARAPRLKGGVSRESGGLTRARARCTNSQYVHALRHYFRLLLVCFITFSHDRRGILIYCTQRAPRVGVCHLTYIHINIFHTKEIKSIT